MPRSDCRQRPLAHPINRVAAFRRNRWPLCLGFRTRRRQPVGEPADRTSDLSPPDHAASWGFRVAAPSATVQFGASATPHQVEFLSPATQTDPKIQGLSFYYSADAASNLLPGMNVLAFLPSGAPIDAIEVSALGCRVVDGGVPGSSAHRRRYIYAPRNSH